MLSFEESLSIAGDGLNVWFRLGLQESLSTKVGRVMTLAEYCSEKYPNANVYKNLDSILRALTDEVISTFNDLPDENRQFGAAMYASEFLRHQLNLQQRLVERCISASPENWSSDPYAILSNKAGTTS